MEIKVRKTSVEEVLMARLPHGGDLLEALTAMSKQQGVTLGKVGAIGAVSRAEFAFYNQETFTYETLIREGDFEIVSLMGNISLKDGEPMVHAHVLFADSQGNVFGGHLLAGCRVFACEATITKLSGEELHRAHDPETRLMLWKM